MGYRHARGGSAGGADAHWLRVRGGIVDQQDQVPEGGQLHDLLAVAVGEIEQPVADEDVGGGSGTAAYPKQVDLILHRTDRELEQLDPFQLGRDRRLAGE